MSQVLLVLHDPPYGTERVVNGLRRAQAMTKAGDEVRVLLFGDAVVSVVRGRSVPNGYYNTGKHTSALVRAGALVGACASCMDARGVDEARLLEGAHRSSLDGLGQWSTWAQKLVHV